DSSGDATRLLEELAVFTKPIYVGSAAILAYAGLLGCAGAILAGGHRGLLGPGPPVCLACRRGRRAGAEAVPR
ncbi:hypothetical protein, partial [Klebsiella pneumoniae]|uniref:hypothetical protein n=1 Tax=Klebsiella pneumoniae TaxID=573 RepID=UPI003A8BC9C8